MSGDTIWGGGSELGSRRARVFISHSAQADDFADDLRRRLAKRLADDYDVLLDEDAIDPGDAWRTKLYRWLGTCDAAIILLNQGVIDNPDWVRFETHVVSWRREFDDDVVVIPVLLPGVTTAHLQEIGLGAAMVDVDAGEGPGEALRVRLRSSPIELTAYQFVDAGGRLLPDDIIDRILQGLRSLPPQRQELSGPIGDWVDEIMRYLPDGRPLREAARTLGVDDQLYGDRSDGHHLDKELVAFALLFSTDLARVESAIDSLARDALFRGRLKDFIPLVIPSWVGESGLAITGVRSSRAARRVVAMDVGDPRSIPDLIRRANCCTMSDVIIERVSATVLTENTELSIERWYSDEVENAYGIDDGDADRRQEEVEQVERSFCDRDKHVFVAMDRAALAPRPGEAGLTAALDRLRSRFRGAVFVLNADDALVAALTSDEVPRCSPAIEAGEERAQRIVANRLFGKVSTDPRPG